MKKINILIILFLIITISNAQIPKCGFDELRNSLYHSIPFYKQKEDKVNKLIYDKTIEESARARLPLVTYTIPLVVHIIHNNGPENISDATVIGAINEMNLRFQNATPYQDSTGHQVGIQFCLASVDPQGNPTTGITRNVSTLTYFDGSMDLQMKNLNRWDPLYYYNIWVVDYIGGFNISVAGYSSFPYNVGNNYDGVVIDHNYMSTPNSVLTHETGHYFGLEHTWSGGCHNDNCLLDGDYVCDTPPDTSTTICRGNSCSSEMNDTSGFNPFTMDMNDLPNYMDYTPCPLSFSQGQADRMNYFLSAVRFKLLQSVGCGFSGGPLPIANFTDTVETCYTGNVTFSDTLCTNANTVSWDFDNNGVYDSYAHNPTYTFPATGTYTVKLRVVGPGGIDSTYRTVFVRKGTSPYYPIIMQGGLYQYPLGTWNTCLGYQNYYTAPPNAQSYLWSTGDTTQTIIFSPASGYNLSLIMIDSLGLTWNSAICTPLTVNVLSPPPLATIYTSDPLVICVGDTVVFHSTGRDTNFVYTWYQGSGAGTGNHDSTFTAVGYSTNVQYLMVGDGNNGCYSYSNALFVDAYNPPAPQTLTQVGMQLTSGWGLGNQWYLNGLPIAGATATTYTVTQSGCYQVAWFFSWVPQCYTMSDTICFTTVEINEINNNDFITISPNPFTSETIISFNEEQKATVIKITDVLGKEIKTTAFNGKQYTIEKGEMSNGIYFVQIKDEQKHIYNRKIIIQ